MKRLTGAVVLLSGAILFAAGALADSLRSNYSSAGELSMILGAIIGLVGMGIVAGHWNSDSPTPQ